MTSGIPPDLKEKVAELLVVRCSAHACDSQRDYPQWELANNELQQLLQAGVGGVILFGGSIVELEYRCRTLRKWSTKPLLLCADIEEGLGQRFAGGSWFAPPMAISNIYSKDSTKAIQLAENYGHSIGTQARRCGLNWVLAPVCDVNTNPDNPVINVRAWGSECEVVADLTSAFIKGLASQRVLSCAKHYPGHGDTEIDSHLDLPFLNHNIQRLRELELIPFQAAITHGVNSVMTGHLLLNQIDAGNIATFSDYLISEILRKQMGFQGLIVTDALVMKAITDRYGPGEAAVKAFSAGVDLILMPESPLEAINAICLALMSGRIPLDRLHQALTRRREALLIVQNASDSTNDPFFDFQDQEFESLQDRALVEELINTSIEVRNPVSIQNNNHGLNLIRVDSVLSSTTLSKQAPAIRIPKIAGYKSLITHDMSIKPWKDNFAEPIDLTNFQHGSIFLQLFIRGNPFHAKNFSQEPWVEVVNQLQKEELLSGLAVYGSPYIWNLLLDVLDQSLPAVYSPAQTNEAQAKVLSLLFPSIDQSQYAHNPLLQEFTD